MVVVHKRLPESGFVSLKVSESEARARVTQGWTLERPALSAPVAPVAADAAPVAPPVVRRGRKARA